MLIPNQRTDVEPKPSLNFDTITQIRAALNHALRGKEDVIEAVLSALLAGGHILFDDLPGLGKTTLGKALAAAVGGTFGRLQGTPDLLPSDVTGFNIFNRKTEEFEFRKGPVFSDVLLADEINRATPRTQSALFEAMGERQVSVDGQTFPLAETFFVIATQNPVDHQGTFELPEAQLDRFALKLSIGYPDKSHEIELLKDEAQRHSGSKVDFDPIITPAQLQQWRAHVARVLVEEKIQGYLIDLATAIRNHSEIKNGLSPRALIIWQRVAQAKALLDQRDFITPDDVQQVARPVLRVRLASGLEEVDSVIDQTIAAIPVP